MFASGIPSPFKVNTVSKAKCVSHTRVMVNVVGSDLKASYAH